MISSSHPDFDDLDKIRTGIFRLVGGPDELTAQLPHLIKNAVDFVLDPVRTGRTKIAELDKVEKTFIGLKIEHYIRDLLGVPKGFKRDLRIDDVDVDIKHTIGSTWMIPPEAYGTEEPCLLIATAKFDGRCSLGLILARKAYLNKSNRDGKCSVSAKGKQNILWLVRDLHYPPSRWDGLDMQRFWQLRQINGGKKRAAQFFRENVGRIVHRSVLQALLFDQRDYMKRIRGNGGARDDLIKEGIMVLSGTFDAKEACCRRIGLSKDEFVAVKNLKA